MAQQWTRVTGPDLHPQKDVRAIANKNRITSSEFVAACEAVGIDNTKRQASKWNNKKGAAYNYAHHVDMNGFKLPKGR